MSPTVEFVVAPFASHEQRLSSLLVSEQVMLKWSPLLDDAGELVCSTTGARLSRAVSASLLECFRDGARIPSAKPLGYAVGRTWFCPKSAAVMERVDGVVSCPRCALSLNEFVYQLIEFNPHPSGWTPTFVDPSLGEDTWEPKEDLLQLHHSQLNRLADLGWYRNRYRIFVFQGDFHGQQLAERSAGSRFEALSALSEVLETFSRE